MINRTLTSKILASASKMPVVAIIGPRQSGKTTLAKSVFTNYAYLSLESPEIYAKAQKDPKRFLTPPDGTPGIIIDEVQRIPSLLSYIQVIVDEKSHAGQYIVTGSQNFLLSQAISQTLAGRIAIHTLLPLSVAELQEAHRLPNSEIDTIFTGFYPRIYDKQLLPTEWLTTYLATYVERDVRLIQNVVDLGTFQRFLQLCAGRIGQILNVSSLAIDCGISPKTANAWLSILEASYIIFFLRPYYKNFSKRLIKNPKLYFYDTGLACALLEIENATQCNNYYARGSLFECMVIADLMKQQYNAGKFAKGYFWRDHSGREVDCVIERGGVAHAIEIKASQTANLAFLDGLNFWTKISGAAPSANVVIYAGNEHIEQNTGIIIGWKESAQLYAKLASDNGFHARIN